jgi:4-amino-4-deoxy-L-arabinose transferase-like glycosyltransferase
MPALANKTANNSRLKTLLIASLIICVAFILRITYVSRTDVYLPIRADARSYCIYAQNLINHGVFSKEVSKNPIPDSFWSPGYPTLLASIIYSFGNKHFYAAALFVQALLGALTAGMVFVIGTFFLPLWAAAAAGVLTACSPHLISIGGYLLTETLFAFTLVLFLLIYMIAVKTEKSVYFISAGALAGVTYLANPVIFFAPLLLAGGFLFRSDINGISSGNKKKKLISLFLVAFLVPWLLWSVRCHLNVPATSSTSTNRALINFIIGAHPDFFEIWRANPRDPTNPAEIDKRKVKGSWSEFLTILTRRILDNPGHYAYWYLYEKPRLLWSWDILIGVGDIYIYPVTTSWFQTSGVASAIYGIMKSIHWWLFFLSLLGGLFLPKYRHSQSGQMIKIIYVCAIYVSAVYVVLQSEPRYSIPLRPLLYLCAMFGLWEISRAAKKLFVRIENKIPLGNSRCQ